MDGRRGEGEDWGNALCWRPKERRPGFVVPALTPEVTDPLIRWVYERDEHQEGHSYGSRELRRHPGSLEG